MGGGGCATSSLNIRAVLRLHLPSSEASSSRISHSTTRLKHIQPSHSIPLKFLYLQLSLSLMSLVRWEDFQQLCEISDTLENPIFGRLWKSVKLHLRNEPKNSIGVMGPKKGKEKFTLWTIKYLDSGIGKQYWGSGTGGKWKFEEDRTQ